MPLVYLPCLEHTMKQRGISVAVLARVSRSSCTTIRKAKRGERIDAGIGKRIAEALELVPQRHMYLFCLDYMMQRAGATNEALAKSSGASIGTICNARRGKRIEAKLGSLLLEALLERKYQYKSHAGLNKLRRNYFEESRVGGLRGLSIQPDVL